MDKNLIVSGFIQINDEIISADDIVPLPERSGSTCLCYMVRYQGKRYLMKRLRREYADNPRYQELFRKEFETGQRLSHEHLVKFVSMGEDVDGCYIIMEYIDGDTLGERMLQNPAFFSDPKRVERLFSQLLDCLGYLHHHQVLHLDLKPDNIMLTRISDVVKLIDLGFCYSDSYDLSMGRNGLYSAPEQNEGKIESINVGTDLYAVGLLLRDVCLLYPKVYGSDAMSALIKKSTQAEPAQRFASAIEMKEALREAFPHEDSHSKKGGKPNKWKAVSALQGVILLVLVVLAGLYFALFGKKETPADFVDAQGIRFHIVSTDDLICHAIGRDYSKVVDRLEHASVHPYAINDDLHYRVVAVGDSAFFADTIIQTLNISEGVEFLSSFSFSRCSRLHTVSLPLSLTAMGRHTFGECPNLQHIVLPDGVKRIANYAFINCPSLTSINFPDELETIGEGSFTYSGLTSAHLPDSLRSIELAAFYGCRRLRSVTLPASLERIGAFCFHQCDSLLEVRNLNPEPQVITNVFGNYTGLPRTLYVPRQSLDLYRSAPYWRDFPQILPLD